MNEPPLRRPRFTLHGRIRSFAFAFSGVRYIFASEHNMWLHAAAAVFAVALGVIVGLSIEEWRWVVLAVGWVWMAEAFNTAIERLADAVTLERDPRIGLVKDLAAAAVLISAAGAALIGALVFVPHLRF